MPHFLFPHTMKTNLLFFLFNLTNFFSCESNDKPGKPFVFKGEKAKGLSYVAPHMPIDSTHIQPVTNIGADWISLMPYGFVRDDSPDFQYISEKDTTKRKHVWWGETPDGVRECIRLAHEKKVKIMLKPHMWIGRGGFTGDMDFKSDTDWKIFEKGYRNYILEFAQLAENEHVEMFCMATEMENSVEERPEFWNNLIKDIRKIYKGKLTYAENWDSYKKVHFWDQLDFIGIDGYFPVSDEKTPIVSQLEKGWETHQKALSNFASKYQKPILFTEFGYRSCDFTAEKPWETDFSLPENELAQANGYEAFFNKIWPEPWFAGAFIWKWFPLLDKNPRHKDTFTPQGKLGEKVLKTRFLNEKLPK
jgi:hypothetical protein